jgi:hypothetical protein
MIYNDYRQIIAYNGATRTATVTPEFSHSIADGLPDLQFEILTFEKDNFNPLVVVASEFSTNQMVCYEITLSQLILPNVILSTGQGNLIAFYPYVYVKFTNVTAKNRYTLYSNNPAAVEVLFKIPITNYVSPTTSTFVPLSSGMTQTIAFKPIDNFEFAVYLPNGELFETLLTDTTPPFPPNPNLQVSATFTLRRVT